MWQPHQLKIMSHFKTNERRKFRLLKGEMQDIKGEFGSHIFAKPYNWLLGQPIYVSIALDLHSHHSLLCLHTDSAQADFHPLFHPTPLD